jgi:hypothetical protein
VSRACHAVRPAPPPAGTSITGFSGVHGAVEIVGQGDGQACARRRCSSRRGSRSSPARHPALDRELGLGWRAALARAEPRLALSNGADCAWPGGCAGSPEPPERLVYLAIGASDAAGVGAEPLTRSYVFRIADELDDCIDEVFLAPLAGDTWRRHRAARCGAATTSRHRDRAGSGDGLKPARTMSSAARTPTTSRMSPRTCSSACAFGPTA